MYTLQAFKSIYKIESLKFYPSKTEGSVKLVAGTPSSGLVVTTDDFDPKKPAFIYQNPKAEEGRGWVISNTQQKEATVTL